MNSKPVKVLFAHDGPLFKDRNNNHYGIHITEKLKQRYLYLGDELTAVMRERMIEDENVKKYSPISPDKFTFVPIPNFKTFRKYLTLRRKVKKDIERLVLDSDIVVARIPSSIGSIVVHYARKHNKPLLCEFVACSWDALWNHSWKGKLVAPYFFLKQKARMKDMPHVVYVTEKFLQDRYPTSGQWTNCSNVELNAIEEASLETRLQKIGNYTKGQELVLGTVAAIDVLYKGQADVIEALAELKKQGVRFKYKLVGQGSPSYLQGRIDALGLNDQVEIIGALKHDEVFKFMNDIDIYIQPSKQEGLPRAVIEAMSRACPVLGAHTGGIPELIGSQYIFPKGDIKKIVSLLKVLDRDELSKMANVNFQKSKEYTADVLAERRFRFFDKFLKDNGLTHKTS